jgi:hypothetical protein
MTEPTKDAATAQDRDWLLFVSGLLIEALRRLGMNP